MNIVEKKIEGLTNKITHKKRPLPISTHKNFPINFYFTYLAYGAKNSGKTYSIVSMIKSIEKYPPKDYLGNILPFRTIWCAPTVNFSSNTIIHTLDSLDEKDIYEECNEDTLKTIFEQIKTEKEMIEKIQIYEIAYKKYLKTDVMKLKFEDIAILNEFNFEDPKEVFKHLKYRSVPIYLWILDDLIGSDAIFGMRKNNFLSNLVIKHRHYQICLLFTTQSQKSIPPVIRKNIDILQLYKSKSMKILEDLYEEVSALITYDQFINLFEHCVNQEFGSLVINNHQDAKHRFYCNFDKQLHF